MGHLPLREGLTVRQARAAGWTGNLNTSIMPVILAAWDLSLFLLLREVALDDALSMRGTTGFAYCALFPCVPVGQQAGVCTLFAQSLSGLLVSWRFARLIMSKLWGEKFTLNLHKVCQSLQCLH